MTPNLHKDKNLAQGIQINTCLGFFLTRISDIHIWIFITNSPDGDRRRDDEFKTFEQYRNSLKMECEDGEPALLEVSKRTEASSSRGQ